MIVETLTATVYKGGGKRYLTKRAAYYAAARAKINSRCDCEPCDYADYETGYMPVMCQWHEDRDRCEAVIQRLARWYQHADKKGGD